MKSLDSHTPQCRALRLCLRNLVLVKMRCPVNSTNSELGVASIVKIHRFHLEVLQGYKHSQDTWGYRATGSWGLWTTLVMGLWHEQAPAAVSEEMGARVLSGCRGPYMVPSCPLPPSTQWAHWLSRVAFHNLCHDSSQLSPPWHIKVTVRATCAVSSGPITTSPATWSQVLPALSRAQTFIPSASIYWVIIMC